MRTTIESPAAAVTLDDVQLHDLAFALRRELLLANSAGASTMSSAVLCNTRKYHGIFTVRRSEADNDTVVLLAAWDETLVRDGAETSLATHRYPGVIHPAGYRHLTHFAYETVPEWTYRVDDVELTKQILLLDDAPRLLIRYVLARASAPVVLRCEPFLTGRRVDTLRHANGSPPGTAAPVAGGVTFAMGEANPPLVIQCSRDPHYRAAPVWYYNVEYEREAERGYASREDVFRPGTFAVPLRPGDEIVFSIALDETAPRDLRRLFARRAHRHGTLRTFDDHARNAARQFFLTTTRGPAVIAGFPWFGRWARDTFIALPGLASAAGWPEMPRRVIDASLADLHDGLFPNAGGAGAPDNAADASLWLFWTLQQEARRTGDAAELWRTYGSALRSILEHFRRGTRHNIHMLDTGLLWEGEDRRALTWMDAVVDGVPVTQRAGLAVDVNALWHNAACFAIEAAGTAGDTRFLQKWHDLPGRIRAAFLATFWDASHGYLADCVAGGVRDWSLRPNQLLAVSLPHPVVLDAEIGTRVVDVARRALLTPRGLRTLAPDDPHYHGRCVGSQTDRDRAYHQGTVWPWLIGPFADAWLRLHPDDGRAFVRALCDGFAPALLEAGLGTIGEIYDGDPPHEPRGAVAQAWSVAEIFRVRALVADVPAPTTTRRARRPA